MYICYVQIIYILVEKFVQLLAILSKPFSEYATLLSFAIFCDLGIQYAYRNIELPGQRNVSGGYPGGGFLSEEA